MKARLLRECLSMIGVICLLGAIISLADYFIRLATAHRLFYPPAEPLLLPYPGGETFSPDLRRLHSVFERAIVDGNSDVRFPARLAPGKSCSIYILKRSWQPGPFPVVETGGMHIRSAQQWWLPLSSRDLRPDLYEYTLSLERNRADQPWPDKLTVRFTNPHGQDLVTVFRRPSPPRVEDGNIDAVYSSQWCGSDNMKPYLSSRTVPVPTKSSWRLLGGVLPLPLSQEITGVDINPRPAFERVFLPPDQHSRAFCVIIWPDPSTNLASVQMSVHLRSGNTRRFTLHEGQQSSAIGCFWERPGTRKRNAAVK